jgi:BirA family biotin operon repressor/biotin-[acetyl-CoA-carboxylase] ligase
MGSINTEFLSDDSGSINYLICKHLCLDSTNKFLKENYTSFKDFTIIWAVEQSEGKGRFDRVWNSIAGKGLTFSAKIPLKAIPVENWTNNTQIMALAISYLYKEYGIQSQIRWPNDVMINGQKAAGILAELVTGPGGAGLILGVGLNVNENQSDLAMLPNSATSLSLATGKPLSTEAVLKKLLTYFSKLYMQFVEDGFAVFVPEISEKLLYSNLPVRVVSGVEEIIGQIVGLSETGLLIIDTGFKKIEINTGEITSRV